MNGCGAQQLAAGLAAPTEETAAAAPASTRLPERSGRSPSPRTSFRCPSPAAESIRQDRFRAVTCEAPRSGTWVLGKTQTRWEFLPDLRKRRPTIGGHSMGVEFPAPQCRWGAPDRAAVRRDSRAQAKALRRRP